MNPAQGGDKHRTIALDVSRNSRAHFDIFGNDGVEEMDIAPFLNHQTMAAHIAYMVSTGPDAELSCAVDVARDMAVNCEVPAVDFRGAYVASFADEHVTACVDGGGGVQIDVEILKADGNSAGGAVGGFSRAPDFEEVATVEAFDLFEIMLTVAAQFLHFVKGALRGCLQADVCYFFNVFARGGAPDPGILAMSFFTRRVCIYPALLIFFQGLISNLGDSWMERTGNWIDLR